MSYRPAAWIITIQVIVTVACILATCAAVISSMIAPSQCPSAPHAPAEAQPEHPDSDPHRASPGTMIQPIEPSSRT